MEGHFDRFGERLRKSGSKQKDRHISPFLKVAAALIIVLLSANLVVHFSITKPKDKETAEIKSDLREASFYYTNSINNGIRDLEQMAKEGIGSKQEIIQIKQELSGMDSLFVNLQQEYKANPNDERIINAMIEHYQTKLEVMSFIVNQLKEIRNETQNKVKNENASI